MIVMLVFLSTIIGWQLYEGPLPAKTFKVFPSTSSDRGDKCGTSRIFALVAGKISNAKCFAFSSLTFLRRARKKRVRKDESLQLKEYLKLGSDLEQKSFPEQVSDPGQGISFRVRI